MQLSAREAWDAGVERELGWWRHYLASGGLDQPEDFRFRFAPDTALQPHIAGLLPARPGDEPRSILDCAAGPATTLGKVHDGTRLAITAVDALAARYDQILSELALEPPVRTMPCEVERLSERVGEDSFDLVYMRFALDHCYDPLAALRHMVRVVRPGCAVLVEHYRDPAETEYQGLRQWELRRAPDDLVVSGRHYSFSLAQALPEADLHVEHTPSWLTVVLRKLRDSS